MYSDFWRADVLKVVNGPRIPQSQPMYSSIQLGTPQHYAPGQSQASSQKIMYGSGQSTQVSGAPMNNNRMVYGAREASRYPQIEAPQHSQSVNGGPVLTIVPPNVNPVLPGYASQYPMNYGYAAQAARPYPAGRRR